jgi:hypothetical protein
MTRPSGGVGSIGGRCNSSDTIVIFYHQNGYFDPEIRKPPPHGTVIDLSGDVHVAITRDPEVVLQF